MTQSARLRLPYIAAAQAQKHVTHNEALTVLDTLVQLAVLDRDLNAPPPEPEEGDTYIVAGKEGDATATGAWEGWEGRVVRLIDGAWRSYLPGAGGGAGWLAWVIDEGAMVRFDGEEWALAGIEGPPGPDGPPGPPGAGLDFGVAVAALADRDAHDNEDPGFRILVNDIGDGRAAIYIMGDGGSGDWSSPAMVTGPEGPPCPDGPPGASFAPDAVVDAFGDRDQYDGEAPLFAVLVAADAGNDGEPTLYFLLEPGNGGPAVWSAGITFVAGAGGGVETVLGIAPDDGDVSFDATDVPTSGGGTFEGDSVEQVLDQIVDDIENLDADMVAYDNTASGLTAEGVQDAIDELAAISPDAPKFVKQSFVHVGTSATGTTQIPQDNTIPQNDEGDEYMTLAHTPEHADNILIVEAVGQFAMSAGGTLKLFVMALFQDAVADALAVSAGGNTSSANCGDQSVLRHRMVAGTTSEIVFKVRAGLGHAGTVTFNGLAGNQLYGGRFASHIRVTEYAP